MKKPPETTNHDLLIAINGLAAKFDQTNKNIGDLTRRVSEVNKSVNLLYDDRSILESINGNLVGLKQQVSDHHDHINNYIKDVKADIGESQTKVESKVDEKVGDLIENIKGKKVVLIKDNWFKILKEKLGFK